MSSKAFTSSARAASARPSPRGSRERGVELREDGAELVLLCVPDAAIAEVAAATSSLGPWVAHVERRDAALRARSAHAALRVHPLQTLHARARARAARRRLGRRHRRVRRGARARLRLAATLGLRPFELADDGRGRSTTRAPCSPSNFLVTLHRRRRATSSTDAGAPPEALVPLMRRTIENGFELTGPISRGDRETVERTSQRSASARRSSSRCTARSPRRPRQLVR